MIELDQTVVWAGIPTTFIKIAQKNKSRGRGRRTAKRRGQRRNNDPMGHGMSPASSGVARMVTSGNGNVFGFPNKLLTRLRYVDTMQLISTSGGLAKQVFRINSTYDPDLTGTGHQPLYRDTYAGIYDQYAVVSAKITLKIINNGSVAIHCGMLVDDDASTSSSYNTLLEQNNGQHTLIPAQSGSLSSHTFYLNWSCEKFLGINPYASETYKTAVGSNPTEESNLLVWMQPVDLAATITNYIQITLEQVVLFTELSTPTGS